MLNKNIIFLSEEQIIKIHGEQISKHGGHTGIRDRHLLLSALGEPQQTFDGKYLRESVFEMAATYLYSFAKNHPFIDGNKRVALKACAIFLSMNRFDLIFSNEEFAELVLNCVNNCINITEIAKQIEDNSINWDLN